MQHWHDCFHLGSSLSIRMMMTSAIMYASCSKVTYEMVEKLSAESDILLVHDSHLPKLEKHEFCLCSKRS